MNEQTGQTITIYGVCDPRTNELRYVGKTTQKLSRRRAHHMCNFGPTYRARWFQSLRQEGITPEFIVLETVSGMDSWQDAERFWIAYFKSLGARLVNATHGGDGALGCPASDERKQKISVANSGRTPTHETRQKISQTLTGFSKGRRLPAETREKISKALTGRKKSEAARKKMSVAGTGRKLPDSAKIKLSQFWEGRKRSAENCANLSKALRGRGNVRPGYRHSDETKAKISAGHKRRREQVCKQ